MNDLVKQRWSNEKMKSILLACVAGVAALALGEAAAPADELARARQKETVNVPEAPEGYRRPKDWKRMPEVKEVEVDDSKGVVMMPEVKDE